MRAWIWSAAALAALTVTAPAWAQRAVGFGSVNPAAIQYKPILVPDAISQRPIAQPQQLSQPNRFRLTDYLPKFMLPSNNPVHGRSTFPTPDQMPGKDYLRGFGYRIPKGIDP